MPFRPFLNSPFEIFYTLFLILFFFLKVFIFILSFYCIPCNYDWSINNDFRDFLYTLLYNICFTFTQLGR